MYSGGRGMPMGYQLMVVNLVPLGGLKRWIKLVVSHRV